MSIEYKPTALRAVIYEVDQDNVSREVVGEIIMTAADGLIPSLPIWRTACDRLRTQLYDYYQRRGRTTIDV